MAAKSRFDEALQKLPGRSFEETCHRIVSLQAYEAANPKRLLYDLGPKLSASGQRFSPPGDHAGLYVAVERLTAGAESAGSVEEWNQSGGGTTVVFKVDVKLEHVLDLTDARVLKALGLTPAEVHSAWEGYHALLARTLSPGFSAGQFLPAAVSTAFCFHPRKIHPLAAASSFSPSV